MEDGRAVAEIFVHSETPREWTRDDIAFVREVAERTHAAIARRAAEQERRESEARFRAVFNSNLIGLAIFDAVEMTTNSINDHFLRMTGHSREDFEAGRWDWRDFTVEGGLDLDYAAIEQARERGWWDPYEKEYQAKDGRRFPVRISSAPMPGYPGKLVVSVEDISESRKWEEHQRLLVGELNHRVKNSLAIVQSLAHQTFPKDDAFQQYVSAYERRLAGLAATHNLLTRANWASADLHALISDALSFHAMASHRIAVSGEQLALAPQPAVSLAMAVHELATNAIKYGSLSKEGGRVDVSWLVDGGKFVFEWQERGGPPVEPPSHRGFGTRMIERVLSSSLGGQAELLFEPEGVTCRITAPAAILA
jgi:PAS domain S-box-containing protein